MTVIGLSCEVLCRALGIRLYLGALLLRVIPSPESSLLPRIKHSVKTGSSQVRMRFQHSTETESVLDPSPGNSGESSQVISRDPSSSLRRNRVLTAIRISNF